MTKWQVMTITFRGVRRILNKFLCNISELLKLNGFAIGNANSKDAKEQARYFRSIDTHRTATLISATPRNSSS